LTRSYLTEPVNGSSALFVHIDYYPIINTTYYLSLVYPLAKKMYPDMQSLHLSALPFSDLIRTKVLSFESASMEL
jgi:hypothetical protein